MGRRWWLVVFAGTLACHDALGPPPTASLEGTYAATTMLRQQDGLNDELLDLGGELTLELRADSTLGGRLRLPADIRATQSSEPVDAVLIGRWSLRGNQIDLRFTPPAPVMS